MAAKEMNFREIEPELMKPEALTDYIVKTHHKYLKKALPETHALFLIILKVHGPNHPELFEVFKLFGRLKTDMEQLMIREEMMLFPAIEDGDKAAAGALAAGIIKEHTGVVGLLKKIRAASHNYALPSDACESYTKLYKTIPEIEEDVRQQFQIEKDFLKREL